MVQKGAGTRQKDVIPAYKIEIDKVALINELDIAPGPLYPAQENFLRSNKRFKFFRAARRVGKSNTAALDIFPELLKEGTRGWIIGPTYDLAAKEMRYLADYMYKYIKKLGLNKQDFTISIRPSTGVLEILTPWGSEAIGKSATKPESLVGEELDWIILSESAMHKENTWKKYALPTLVTRKGRAIFPSTPDGAGEWLYQLELASEKWKDWEVFTCSQEDVPHITKEEIDVNRRQMGEEEFREQIHGEWRFFTGRVYPKFREENVIDSFPIPTSWPVWAGLDFGHHDATAMLYVAKSPSDDYYVFHEHYSNNMSTKAHVDQIMQFEARLRNHLVARVADYHGLGKQLMLDWKQYGLPTKPCVNDVKGKRDRLMAMLEPREDHIPYHFAKEGRNGTNMPRLYVFGDKCPNLVKEFKWLRWREGASKEGRSNDTIGPDHAVNALEYAIHDATTHEFRRYKRHLFNMEQTKWCSFA